MLKKSDIRQHSLSEITSIALDNYEFRFLDHSINVISNYKDANFYLFPNRKYDVQITTFSGYKGLYINNIKMKEKDSVVLNVYLKEPALIFCE